MNSPGGALGGQPPPQQNPIVRLLMALKQHLSGQQGQGQAGGPGGATPPFQPSTTQGGQGPRGTLPMPTPGGGGQSGASPSGGGPPSSTGQMVSAIDPQGTKAYEGFQGLAGLLQLWTSRKSEKEHVEAANIAQKLRKAMDDNDVATVHEILNDKNATKVLNKVYKGWLTKSQEAQKPGKEPDPAVSGFEKGVADYEKGKAQQPPKGGRTEGGYLLPQAGPQQQLAGIKTGAELSAAQQDPKRTLDTQLTSDEMRSAERGKAGLEMTPANEAKMKESMAKLRQAQLGVQKAELELQSKQAELQASGERYSAASKKAEVDLQKSQVQLDITRTNLLIARERATTQGKKQQPPVATVQKLTALEQAETYVKDVLKSRGKAGFTGQDVQTLTGLLRQAGSISLAQSLPGWYGRNMSTWFGGKGEEDVAGMLESIQALKGGIQETIDARYPDWQTPDKKAKSGEEPPPEDDEVDADIVVNPEDMKPN